MKTDQPIAFAAPASFRAAPSADDPVELAAGAVEGGWWERALTEQAREAYAEVIPALEPVQVLVGPNHHQIVRASVPGPWEASRLCSELRALAADVEIVHSVAAEDLERVGPERAAAADAEYDAEYSVIRDGAIAAITEFVVARDGLRRAGHARALVLILERLGAVGPPPRDDLIAPRPPAMRTRTIGASAYVRNEPSTVATPLGIDESTPAYPENRVVMIPNSG